MCRALSADKYEHIMVIEQGHYRILNNILEVWPATLTLAVSLIPQHPTAHRYEKVVIYIVLW